MRYLAITAVNHSSGDILPHISHSIDFDAQAESRQFLIEGIKPVIECPKGLASFCSSKHILITSFGNGIFQRGIDGDKLRSCLDIEIIETGCSNYSLWVLSNGFFQIAEIDEESYAVIVERGTCF